MFFSRLENLCGSHAWPELLFFLLNELAALLFMQSKYSQSEAHLSKTIPADICLR